MNFKTHFLDVGQGDTSFVELPNGQYMLVDCNIDNEGINIIDYIKQVIPKRDGKYLLDYVVLTHPHKDHIKGLKDLVDDDEIKIGEVWESGHRTRDDDQDYKNYVEIMNRSSLDVRKVKASSSPYKEQDDIKFYIFSPSTYLNEDDSEDMRKAIHQRCMVMKIEHNGKSVMFTGDSHFECWQNRIVPYYSDDNTELEENLLKSDVLSVSHHGSRTFFMDNEGDEPYLDGIHKISPIICVISCSKDNDHGHPHDEAVEIYQKEQDDGVYITKEDGTVVVDMNDLSVVTKNTNTHKYLQLIPRENLNLRIKVYHSQHTLTENGNGVNKPSDAVGIDRESIHVKRGGSLYFEVENPRIDCTYKWTVHNFGKEAYEAYQRGRVDALGNQSDGNKTSRDLHWRGRHSITCEMLGNTGQLIDKKVLQVRIKN